jgi:hypothetical protein
MSEITLKLKYEAGTLILEGAEENDFVPNAFVWDKRTRQFRSPAYKYREIIKEFIRTKTAYEDAANDTTNSLSSRNFTSRRVRIKPLRSKRGGKTSGAA